MDAVGSIDSSVVTSVMRALSNPNRLKIFLLLKEASAEGGQGAGLRVGEIAERLEVTQSTVSHHLRELEHAGLIRLERRGKNVICSIEVHPLTNVIEVIDCSDI